MGLLSAARRGIRAFHGSPHDFDRFDMSRIGTGEGAQAYGHGLYFAEAEDVARSYRDALTSGSVSQYRFRGDPVRYGTPEHEIAYRAFHSSDGIGTTSGVGLQQAISDARASYKAALRDGSADRHGLRPKIEDALRRIDAGEFRAEDFAVSPGRMYEVRINAEPEEFLDWDAPLSGQSEPVRRAWDRMIAAPVGRRANESVHGALSRGEGQFADPSGESFYKTLYEGFYRPGRSGGEAGVFPEASLAASYLRREGIPGIRYLDGNSRSAGEGSRNYVVFDDSLIEILRKYGIAGLGTGGLLSLATGRQQQET